MNKILEYEKKLMEYRMELNHLIDEYYSKDGQDIKLLEYKIDCLKKELFHLNHQLDLLKSNLAMGTEPLPNMVSESAKSQSEVRDNVNVNNTNNAYQPYYAGDSSASNAYQPYYTANDAKPLYANNASASGANKPYYTNSTTTVQPRTDTKKSLHIPKDFESLFGKSLMGVFASVLIFISFIFFATLVLPHLNNTIKMILMYIVSFAFTGFGLFLLNKNNKNKLYLSITGCGLGAIYISLLISNMYFKAINDIALYLLIFVWVIFIYILSRFKSWIFQVIGQCGIFSAIIFGCILCHNTEDWAKLLFLIVFFVITESIFYVSNLQADYKKNVFSHVAILLSLFVFGLSMPYYNSGTDPAITFSHIILLLFIFCNLLSSFFISTVKDNATLAFSVINIFYMLFFLQLFVFPSEPVMIIALALLILLCIEWTFDGTNRSGIIPLQAFSMFLLPINVYNLYTIDLFKFVSDYIYLAPLAIAFAVYGYLKKDRVYKICSIIYLVLFIFNYDMKYTANVIFGLILFATMAYLLKYRSQYSVKVKTVLYCIFLIFVVKTASFYFDHAHFHYRTEDFIVFTMISILNIAAIKTPFSKNWINGENEKPFRIFTTIINTILMFYALDMIYSTSRMDNPWMHISVILIAFALFMINSKNLLQRGNIALGIYVGIKFTILMNVVLDSFHSPNYVISIACLLFAIGSIICGFLMRFKSLRVYGLALSLLSIAKLILLDINYDNTIGRALSFFICGILCFIISTIYNIVDKKMAETRVEE